MKANVPNEVARTLQEARAYLDKLTSDVSVQPDFPRMHRYLAVLTPHLQDSHIPADLTGTVAQLYFESMRYAESAAVLLGYQDLTYNEMRVNNDFFSSYFVPSNHWVSRQKTIWGIFLAQEKALLRGKDSDALQAMNALRDQLDPYFPTRQLAITLPWHDEPGILCLGNPDGIFSLVPMLYLGKHAPSTVSRHWNVCLAADETYNGSFIIGEETVPAKEIQVRITPAAFSVLDSRVDLTLWHPALGQIAKAQSDAAAADWARSLASMAVPPAAYALHVGTVSAGKPAPSEKTLPLSDLSLWFMDHDMDPDVPMPKLLERRRYTFTRTPTSVSRPRADIVRGETCMPELEQIYFLRDNKGMAALQRYGVGYWFLTIPRKVCGEDFQTFRQRLESELRSSQGDQIFFTGWAEGTQNCYLDFLSLGGYDTLRSVDEYCGARRGGRNIHICTFYWNSPLRTLSYAKELGQFNLIEMQGMFGLMEPPKDLTSPAERAVLERAFRETTWTDQTGKTGQGDGSAAQADLELLREQLQKTIQHVMAWDSAGMPYNYLLLHTMVDTALSKAAHLDVDEDLCDAMSSVLMAADRYRDAAGWKSRVSPSEEKTTFLYNCDIASDYPFVLHTWELRRQAFYKYFSAEEYGLAQYLSNARDRSKASDFLLQLEVVFPVTEVSMHRAAAGRKDTILTGLPDGILTLPAMQYFCSHRPAGNRKRWDIAISGAGAFTDRLVDTTVSLTEKGGKVSLAVWHPSLSEAPGDEAPISNALAAQAVNEALPMGARLLYVDEITAAPEEPEDAFPLAELQREMQALGYQTDISLDALLSRRRYRITREPRDTDRPRDDILRGETCMPELERIYNHLYDEGQSILEKYGLYAGSLMIPNALCAEDPAQYREQLQRRIALAEGDKIFFTGWAEGTKYCYLDFISMDGQSLLNTLNEYALGSQGGGWPRLCGFFWRSTPRSWIRQTANEQMRSETHEEYADFAREHTVPDFPVPDAEAAAAFEASFQPLFTPEDLCAPAPTPEPDPTAPRPNGKKKLSKAQRKAQNARDNKNNKKKR